MHTIKFFRMILFLGGLAGAFLAPQAQAAEASRPNILFCIADDAGMHMGAYGYEGVATPALDSVAKNGILFTKAYTPDPKCAPSRSSILTGRNPWQLEAAANHWCNFPPQFKTFPEVLSENGYKVGYTGKGWGPGVSLNAKGENRDLIGQIYNENKLNPPTSKISPNDYAQNFKNFLEEKKPQEPFFFWLGTHEPHRSYEYGSGARLRHSPFSSFKWFPRFWPMTDEVKNDLQDYLYELEYFDQQVGKAIQILKEKNLLENTIIMITSDNGISFPRSKGQCYELSSHLPLAVSWPNGIQRPGRKMDDFVSFIDFAPTLLEVAGVDLSRSGMKPITGKSFAPVFKSSASKVPFRSEVLLGRERQDVGRPGDVGYPVRGIRSGDFLLLKNYKTDRWPSGDPETGYTETDGGPTKTAILNARKNPEQAKLWELCFGKRPAGELYQVTSDPDCMVNLYNNPSFSATREKMEKALDQKLKEEGDPRALGQGEIFDQYPTADQKVIHLYERTKNGETIETNWLNPSDRESINP